MATGTLNIDLGFALGKHLVKYSLNHTGKGYVSVIANMPFLSAIKESTSQEIVIRPCPENFQKIEQIMYVLGAYEKLLQFQQKFGLVINDRPTFDLGKIKEIVKNQNLKIFSRFFSVKAGVETAEIRAFLEQMQLALKVEKNRC